MNASTRTFNFRRLAMVGVLAVAGVASAGAFAMGGLGGHGHGGHGRGGMGDGPMQGMMMERMLDRVNATADQKAQIKKIMDTARAEQKARHDAHQVLRDQAVKLFTAPTIDANAIEQLRQQQSAARDDASRRMTQAMVDAARVLTPEQRQQIASQMARRGEMMKRHQHERQQLEGAPKRPGA